MIYSCDANLNFHHPLLQFHMILKKSFIRIMIFQIGTQETFCGVIAVKYSLSAQLYSENQV